MRAKFAPNPSTPHSSPTRGKRLVYLDQSFLTDMCFRGENTPTPSSSILGRLFLKLQDLKAISKIVMVVSDIHCRETSNFPGQYAERMEKLWKFQNGLADGRIAANWEDVLVAQHRRMLSDDSLSYPFADIRLRDSPQAYNGVRVIMTNSSLLRIHRSNVATFEEIDGRYQEVIDRQAMNLPRCDGITDCHNYILGLWGADIQAGIDAWRQRRDFDLSFDQLGKSPNAKSLASLKLPDLNVTPFLGVIRNVIHGLDGEVALQRWSDLLEKDSIGPCPSLRIRAALEAELLWTWHEGKRRNPKTFSVNFGRSRQNDIDHVSTFVPYVDALTTDNDMHNLCKRKVVNDEIVPFPCRIFSAKNYDEFEDWLNELLVESTTSNQGEKSKEANSHF